MGNYLVTGGAGFIGSHISRRLVADGHSVRVLDNLITGHRHRLADLEGQLEFQEGDLRNPDDCAKACADVEVVFHQAALPSVPRSVENPAEAHAHNVDGTFNLLLAARNAKCRRVVYAASSSAYGDQPELPKHERMMPSPKSPYAFNKLAGEYYCKVFCDTYGLDTIALRYFNVFGPSQDPNSQYAAAIPAFVTAILKGEPPHVYGDGEQTRDFTYIDNVVHANMLAGQAKRTCGRVVNVACGERVTINEILAQINSLLGTSIQSRHTDNRAGDVKHSLADIAQARELLGYEPQILFAEGLRLAIDWYRDNL